jgi:phosphate transport system protein
MQSHLEANMQQDIDLIRSKVVEMGGLAEKALETCLGAIKQNDRQLAYAVILRDRHIDELEDTLESLCQKFLIKHLPVASQMRFVYSVIKINTELERVGDYAKAIARRFLTVSDLGTQASYPKLINIANLAIPFLRNALQAFTERDAELAKATREREKERTIDNMRYEIHSDLIQLHINGELPSEALVPLVTIVGCLERVANQASNICEEVLYMCTGEDLRHDYHQVLRVLCVAEHDACRGQMAVGIGNGLEPKRILFSSAGVASQPLDPKTVEFMAEKGIDISGQASKYLSQILDLKDYAIIVSLCEEAERGLPSLPSRPVRINWKVQDPSRIEGTEEEIHAAYQKTFQFLDTHLRELVQAILGDDVEKEKETNV